MVDGKFEALVRGNRKSRVFFRVHWIPYEVPMGEALKELCNLNAVKIISSRYEICTEPGFENARTGVRLVTMKVKDPNVIPHFVVWRFNGQ